jgi:cyclase
VYKRPRIIPCLTMQHMDMVKTIHFKNPRYIGDPVNSVRIFNNKDVDEMCILDITATIERREPDFGFLHEIASEAFMPLGYGGGIKTLSQAKEIFRIGYEKVVLNSLIFDDPEEVKRIVDFAGSQSVVASIDYKRDLFGKCGVITHCGRNKTGKAVDEAIRYAEDLGIGEIILTSIDHEGQMEGYDLKVMQKIGRNIQVPVILNGGAGSIDDIAEALKRGADAVAVSSFFVYYGSNRAVLINMPGEEEYLRRGIYEDFD